MKFIAVLLLVIPLSLKAEGDCKPFPVRVIPPERKVEPPVEEYDYFSRNDAEKWSTTRLRGEGGLILQHDQTRKTVRLQDTTHVMTSPDKNTVLAEKKSGGSIAIVGMNTGDFKTTEFPHAPDDYRGNNWIVSPSGQYVAKSESKYENNISTYLLHVHDLKSGAKHQVKWPNYIEHTRINFLPDGKHIIAGDSSNFYIYDIEKGSLVGRATSTDIRSSLYLPEHNQILEWDYQGRFNIFAISPGYHYSDDNRTFFFPGMKDCDVIGRPSTDLTRSLFRCGTELFSVDLKNQKVLDRIALEVNVTVNASPNGKFISTSPYYNGTSKSQLIQVNEAGTFETNFKLNTDRNNGISATDHGFAASYTFAIPGVLSNEYITVRLNLVCPLSLEPGKCPNCGTDAVGSLPLDSIHKKWLEEAELASLCKLPFSAGDWDKSFPVPTSDKVSEKELMAFLLRFQKPGGFDSSKHIRLLITILNSVLSVKEPLLITGMLQEINLADPLLYDHLLRIYPFLKDLKTSTSSVNPCRTDKEAKDLEKKVHEYLEKRIKDAGSAKEFSYFEPLKLYTPILAQIPKDKRHKAVEDITEAVRGAAISDDQLKNVFPSKLYYLAMSAVAPIFGQNHEGIVTDLTHERNSNNELVPIILGPSSIGQSEPTRYGFHARKLAPIPINRDATKPQDYKMRWHQNGETFEGTLTVEPADMKDIVSTDKAPKYDEMYADGKLTGAIIIGTNLKSHAGLMDQYLNYYTDQGFHFSGRKTKVSDMLAFFKNGVEKGEWDYFVKEAHSDGDEKNLFRFDKTSEYLKGVKRNMDGTEEVIYLVYPDTNSSDSVLLSNQDFGEWMRTRKKDGKGQLVYFNTSCGSAYKAVREVEAARTNTFVDVATGNTAHTFGNHAGSAFRSVLHGFRSKKSYEDIRKDLAATTGFDRNKADNYLFPDDPEYKIRVTDGLLPYGIKIGIKDGKGKDYHIDEVLRSFH